MKTASSHPTRREFTKTTLLAGAAVASGALKAAAAEPARRRIRTGVIGCGSVSGAYLPVLTKSPFVEVVSVCDIKPERARQRAEKFRIAHHYPNIPTSTRCWPANRSSSSSTSPTCRSTRS
jgi:hypothetical protein